MVDVKGTGSVMVVALFWFRFGVGTDDLEAIGAAAAVADKFDDVGAVAVAADLNVIGASDGVVACCTIVGALFFRRFRGGATGATS